MLKQHILHDNKANPLNVTNASHIYDALRSMQYVM